LRTAAADPGLTHFAVIVASDGSIERIANPQHLRAAERLLTEKAAQYDRTLTKVGRWEPTSQICSACGVKDGARPLSIRSWTCAACGAAHDRDVNAARNILVTAGLAETQNACGADIRPPFGAAVGVEAGTHRGVA
jgi:putative transposase